MESYTNRDNEIHRDITNGNDISEHDNYEENDADLVEYEEILIAMLNEKNAR